VYIGLQALKTFASTNPVQNERANRAPIGVAWLVGLKAENKPTPIGESWDKSKGLKRGTF
jgi:hypothetical protein